MGRVKKYVLWLISLKQGTMLDCSLHNTATTSFVISYILQVRDCISQNPLKSFKYANKRTPARFGKQKKDTVLFSRSGCSQLSHSNFLTSKWELLIFMLQIKPTFDAFKRFLSTVAASHWTMENHFWWGLQSMSSWNLT